MIFREKAKDNWEKDLLQSFDEKDILILRAQLKQIRNSINDNYVNYKMNAIGDIKI